MTSVIELNSGMSQMLGYPIGSLPEKLLSFETDF